MERGCARYLPDSVTYVGVEVDVAPAFGVLHHLDDEAADVLVRPAQSLLRTGGRLVALVLCRAQGALLPARRMLTVTCGRGGGFALVSLDAVGDA